MKKLLRASLLVLALSFSGASFATPAHAAATNDILPFYANGSLRDYQAQCAETIKTQTEATRNETDERKKIGSSQCTKKIGTVDIFCRVEAVNFQGDINCTFTAPDKSKVVGNPHFALGAETKNYDSTGKLLTSEEKGGLNDGDKTGNPPAEGGLSATDSGACDNSIGCTVAKLPGMLMSGIAFLLLTLSGLLLGVAGVVFNWVVIRTVFQFALYFGTSDGMLVAWGVIRDIANIALLFGFIFMGIATILNTQGMEGYTAKKALPRLIIFAVLLNFSLFATQAIIDVSNGFSSVFASYAGEQCDTTTSSTGVNGQSNENCSNVGISGKIIGAAGLSKVFPSGFSNSFDKPYTYAVMLIILSLLVTVAAMVLFAAAIMLVIRVVVLSLLMVTSPIGFAGMAIPALQPIAKDWWHKLINQAFFAPIYLLMIFVSLKLVDGLQEGNTGIADALMGNTASAGNSVATATTTAGNMQVIVVFIIVIGFMIAALMIAQKMGAYGASFATKSAAAVTFGAHGFVARRTMGRASVAVAQNIRNSKFGETNLGRTFAGVADYGGKASFSTRNLVGGAVKGFGGVDMGKANKTAGHGYHGIEEKAVKDRAEYAKSLTGPRNESTAEMNERVAKEQKDLAERKENAAAALTQTTESEAVAQAAVTDAVRNRDTQKSHRENTLRSLAEQKTVVAKNPGDADAQVALTQLEDQLVRDNADLDEAEQALVQANQSQVAATNALTAARSEEAEAAAISIDITNPKQIGSKQRQANYANKIHHQTGASVFGFPLTLEKHANHIAADKILNSSKSDLEKALEAEIKKGVDAATQAQANDHANDSHGAADAHTTKAKTGGAHAAPGHDH